MADINWGILQAPQSPGIQSSMGSAPSAPAAQNQGLSGLGAGVAQIQDAMATKQKMGLLDQENARAQALQPGLLQAQADAHAKLQSEQAAAQFDKKVSQDAAAAYEKGVNQGGQDGGFDAMQETYIKSGKPDEALKLATTRETLKGMLAENNAKAITNLGSAVHDIMINVVPPIPPQQGPNGQVIPGNPGKTALQSYTEKYPLLKRVDPGAPDPKSFKSDDDFINTYAHPVLATALPYQKEEAAKQELLKSDDLYKAQAVVKENQSALQSAIKSYGPSSQQAQDAADNLKQANDAAASVAGGKITDKVARFIGLNRTTNTSDLIKSNTPGNVKVDEKAAPVFSASEIQAELARRAGSK